MVKKKRKQKTTKYISPEGNRENVFYNFLRDIYKPKKNKINITVSDIRGGSSDTILLQSIKMKNNYDISIAWFDEDDKLSEEIRENLEQAWGCKLDETVKDIDLQETCNTDNRNPILIASNPVAFDGMLIKILGKKLPDLNCGLKEQKTRVKSAISGIIGKGRFDEEAEMKYYQKYLTKEILEQKAKEIYELELLLRIFGKNSKLK